MDVLSLMKLGGKVADCTNPIMQHFRLVKLVASAGQEMVWKIYDAVRVKDGKEASVFLFEKKMADKIHKPKRREIVSDLLRRDVINLMRFKHTKILRVLHCLEECNDSLAFATEPVVASLGNVLGNVDRLPASVQQELKEFSFTDIQIKYGILQVAEALCYLHVTERMLHLNVSPQNIIITKKGMWKLSGFGFLQSAIVLDGNVKDACNVQQWSAKNSKMAQPDLDYIAPEVQRGLVKFATPSADVFSLAMLIIAIYNNGKSLFQAANNPLNYSMQYDKIGDRFNEIAGVLPPVLLEPVERMSNKEYRNRPTAQSFVMLKYFDDAVVHCMDNMDAVDSMDLSQKCEFFALLVQTIPQFPRKLLYSSVLTMLRENMENPDTLVLILPSLVAIIEHATDEDYRTILQSELKKVIAMTRPIQATVYLLEKLPVLLTKVSEEDIRTDILPMIFSTLESNSIQGQEAAINVFCSIKKYLDEQTMKKLVLPKAKALFCKSTNVKTRVCALECMNRLLDGLDKMMILEDILPFLTEIQCTDVDITMAVVAIYKHLLGDKKFGLTHSILATRVMPTLIPLTVTPGLSLQQFTTLMEVLHDMLDEIERQRLTKMANEIPDEVDVSKRTSLDVRLKITDTTGHDVCSFTANRGLLNVDEKYSAKSRQPSNPDILNNLSADIEMQKPYRRHSSFQGLGAAEQAALENIVRQGQQQQQQQQRRGSKVSPGLKPAAAPHIMVSEASVNDFKEHTYSGSGSMTPRRGSTTSIGPIITLPEIGGQRDNFGRLAAQGPQSGRRPSFQGMCDSALQFFGGK